MNLPVSPFPPARVQEMFDLLRDLVIIQSGTRNRDGVNRVGQRIRAALAGLDLETEVIDGNGFGDHLVFRSRGALAGRPSILITGHMDTVFPADTTFTGYRREGDRIHGPGVIDMKGGLVVTICAVRALARAGLLAHLPLILLFNSDEETGSPSSIPLLKRMAGESCCALVTECGGVNGEVVTGRRGKTGYRLDVHGRAGHAAFAGPDKASAILELAARIVRLEACNDPGSGVVVNVGRVEGGIGPNTVAEHAMALVDTRYPDRATGKRLQEEIRRICSGPAAASTRCELSVTNQRPVMERTDANLRLFRLLAEVGKELAITVREEIRQGVSDANTLAGEGLPVLDGLGPVGEFDHSDREYMRARSLEERTLLLANFLPRLADLFRDRDRH